MLILFAEILNCDWFGSQHLQVVSLDLPALAQPKQGVEAPHDTDNNVEYDITKI